MTDRVWLTWENQRRSRELAAHFGCELFLMSGEGFARYPKLTLQTLRVLVRERPREVFAQNPSMILACVVVLWSKLTPSISIIDRHTTFLLNRSYRPGLWLFLFRLMHAFTLRFADVTIVTNEHLATLVRAAGGNPVVLPDKLPSFSTSSSQRYPLRSYRRSILLVASFAEDEPIREAVAAMARIAAVDSTDLYVSGRANRSYHDVLQSAPGNVTFTGFLSEEDYISLLLSVDVVMALTTADHTMLCGCYEAVAAERVLVTSSKAVLREYFKGAEFVENTPDGIASGLNRALANLVSKQEEIRVLKKQLEISWLASAAEVISSIDACSKNVVASRSH